MSKPGCLEEVGRDALVDPAKRKRVLDDGARDVHVLRVRLGAGADGVGAGLERR